MAAFFRVTVPLCVCVCVCVLLLAPSSLRSSPGHHYVFAAADAPRTWTFYEFLQGDWEVTRSSISLKSNEPMFDELLRRYTFERENDTQNLIGRYYENDTMTGDISNELDILINFNTEDSGVFQTSISALDDYDSNVKALFEFDFVDHGKGLHLSFGAWQGESLGSYQFAVSSWDRFTIIIYPEVSTSEEDDDEEDNEVIIFNATKVPVIRERTFFQKYGTFIFIGFFILYNMVLKKKMNPYAQQMRVQREQKNRGQDDSDDKATVELIDENESSNANANGSGNGDADADASAE